MDENIKILLEKINFPIVIKNKINNWPIIHFSNEKWCNVFNEGKLKFRQGNLSSRWEGDCSSINLTFEEFIEKSKNKSDGWLYFDYKEVKSSVNYKEFFDSVRWADVGYSDLSVKDSTIWIGNEGAHTPCHRDTYGYNIVAQVLGRKLWLLAPPDNKSFMPTRVPYEESSIYCKSDFFIPNAHLPKRLYKVVLEPGDFLYVPRHWWHYVENLEVAISINTWIPTDLDAESRMDEILVRRMVYNTIMGMDVEQAKQLLNPNEYDMLQGFYNIDEITTTVNRECMGGRYKQMNDALETKLNGGNKRKIVDNPVDKGDKKLKTDETNKFNLLDEIPETSADHEKRSLCNKFYWALECSENNGMYITRTKKQYYSKEGESAVKECQAIDREWDNGDVSSMNRRRIITTQCQEIIDSLGRDYIPVPHLSDFDRCEYIAGKGNKHQYDPNLVRETPFGRYKYNALNVAVNSSVSWINTFCSPKVIEVAKERFLHETNLSMYIRRNWK